MNVDPEGRDTIIVIFNSPSGGSGSFFGEHSGVYITDNHGSESNGHGNALYDPAGSSFPNIGSGDLFSGEGTPTLNEYLNGATGSVDIITFGTSPSEEAQIIQNAIDQGGAFGGFCAANVAGAIGGVGPFANMPTGFYTPYGLSNYLNSLPGASSTTLSPPLR
jgi:hypothetical protein